MPVQFALTVSIVTCDSDHLPVMSKMKQQTSCRFGLLFLEDHKLVLWGSTSCFHGVCQPLGVSGPV